MDHYLDPTTQQQVEDFHRRLGKMEMFCKMAAATLAADRIRRDVAKFNQPPIGHRHFRLPRRVLGTGWRLLAHKGTALRRVFSRKHHAKTDIPSITIIDYQETEEAECV